MTTRFETRSTLYNFDLIEADDELDLELTRLYAKHCEAVRNKSETEVEKYLQDKASQSKKDYHDVVSALLYGALTEPEKTKIFFRALSSVNRDNFLVLITKLEAIAMSNKFVNLKLPVREQMFSLVSELSNLAVSVKTIYLYIMRQIRGGDISQSNLLLCDQTLRLLEANRPHLDPDVSNTAVYTYLRIIADHKIPSLSSHQQREVRFVVSIMRDKWHDCIHIGRDLVRVLQELSYIPDIALLWKDILEHPQKLSRNFTGVEKLLTICTPKDFLRSRLTPDIEYRLLYILQNLRTNNYQRNLNWFESRFLMAPEAESYYTDIVRYLVAAWYPSNQILQSDIVTRYIIIGSMLQHIKSKTILANVKTALIYDWLFFTAKDNIMLIEPAMLLMERSAERYPSITLAIMEHLKRSADEFFPPMRDYMYKCVSCGMKMLLTKGVIRSLIPTYRLPMIKPATREIMKALFGEFLAEEDQQQSLSQQPLPQQPPFKPSTPTITDVPLPSISSPSISLIQPKVTTPKTVYANPVAEFGEDEDEYLYGESDVKTTTTSTPDTNGDMDMDDADKSDQQSLNIAPQPIIGGDEEQVMTDNDLDEEYQSIDSKEDSMSHLEGTEHIDEQHQKQKQMEGIEEKEEEEEEEDTKEEGLQNSQSYWIFGNSLKQFKEACENVSLSQRNGDRDEYDTRLVIAKKNLKEILAVFLRMAIPAETLGSSIGPLIRNMIASTLLVHDCDFSAGDDIESVILDPAKDVFDLIMATFWSVFNDVPLLNKIMKFIGCISHTDTTKYKSRRHIVSMRWWTFMATLLENEETKEVLQVQEWFPKMIENYQTFVKYVQEAEKSIIDQDEFLRDYLKQDLKMLAENSATKFNSLVPVLYEYLPNVMVGDSDMLRMTIMMLLPDTMGVITSKIHCGSLRIFGEQASAIFLENSFTFAAYENMCFWQLLAAELQGKYEDIEEFFTETQVIQELRLKFKNEIVSSLFSILTSVEPSKDLILSVVRILPDEYKAFVPQVQFALASFKYWSTNTSEVFIPSLSSLIDSMIEQGIDMNEGDRKSTSNLISILETWWDQKLASESFKKDKSLLSNASILAEMIGKTYPKEWTHTESRRKKRIVFADSDEE